MKFDQELVDKYLARAMDEFQTNPLAVQLMRRLALEGQELFVSAGLKHMLTAESGNAHRMLGYLLLRQDTLLDRIADPATSTHAGAVQLFRRFHEMEASFDVRMARKLPRRGAWNETGYFDGAQSGRALDILDETSQGRRLLPILGHLPDSHDPRISARATLFVGKRVQSADWTARQLTRSDPQIRANAVESLWGVKTSAAMSLFDQCVHDDANCVAGNALAGLHIGGRTDAIGQIIEMSNDETAERRITAVWAMGRLAADGFVERLTEMVRDDDAAVRGMALRALMLIRDTSPKSNVPEDPAREQEAQPENLPDEMETQQEDLVRAIDIRLDGRTFRTG